MQYFIKRAILWTTEEFGLIGVQEYVKRHDAEMDKFVTVFESDIGTFRPLGLDFSGTDEAGCILQVIFLLL
jgi:carboxypeptidase Q